MVVCGSVKRIRIRLLNVSRLRRGVSPVIATVFLIGLFVAAIGAVLTIIYPNLQTIDDQIQINSTSSHLQTLDDGLRALLVQSSGTEKLIKLRAESSTIIGDNVSTMTIIPFMNGTDMSSFVTSITFPRIVITNPLASDLYSPFEHQYLRGTANQDFFSLNETTIRDTPWSILNVSRPSDKPILNSSLSYRMMVKNEFQSGNSIVTTLTYVNFNFVGALFKTIATSNIKFQYNGVIESPIFTRLYNTNAGNIKLSLSTKLAGNNAFVEVPLQFAGSSFYWTLNLRYYDVNVSFE